MPVSIKKRWVIADKIPADLDSQLGDYPPFLRQILFNRGVKDAAEAHRFLDSRDTGWDPFDLPDMHPAVDRILQAIDANERIAVYGDYDVDGVTATVLLVQVISALGGNVREYIPSRFEEGYGLNNDALVTLFNDSVRLVVTVDCGIRSPREVEYGCGLGLDMIVSDHHHPGLELPSCHAVICPRLEGNLYPEINLAGVGLAYKIAQALLRQRPVAGLRAEDWLDLVALGTVADIVPLVGENRALVRGGLDRIRWARRQGLVSLATVSGLVISRISAGDIGFTLGPRLNAAGRLDSALAAFRLLAQDDLQTSGLLAQQLDDQNRQRQRLTQALQREAELQLAEQPPAQLIFSIHRGEDPVVSGIVGLVAAKLAESYYRPAVVAYMGPETTRASCRSIPEFHITKALDECQDLLVRHGGHAAAAGFTVQNDKLSELCDRLQRIAERELDGLELRPLLRVDCEVPLADLRPDYLHWLDKLQPTGMQNPEALFLARNVPVIKARQVGSDSAHLKLTLCDDRRMYWDAIAFRLGHMYNGLPKNIDLVYQLEINSYNGNESLQLKVKDLCPAGEACN